MNQNPPGQSPLFKSFLMGGFESASHINHGKKRIDMIAATQHDTQAAQDYALVKTEDIHTVRDGIRWPMIERNGSFDFSSFEPMFNAAAENGMQVIWTLCHYGWPDDVDVFSPEFVTRFARYSREVARFIQARSDAVPFYTPMNEISFLSWAAGQVGWIYPYGRDRGAELKRQLIRATIACMNAIWEVDPRARFMHVDPVINILPRNKKPETVKEAAFFNELQFEASDMLAGLKEPELGGHARYLDIMGANFYHDNQWEHNGKRLKWDKTPRDKRWKPLSQLLEDLYQRYGRPVVLGETSHVGGYRPAWMHEITNEIHKLQARNIPIEGVCLYPIIDRPDWENMNHWHNSGLWDYKGETGGLHSRVLFQEYAEEVRRARQLLTHG